MCSFGGPNMDILFVTTGRALATPEEAGGPTVGGSVFAIHDTGSIGIAEGAFG